MGHHLPFSLVKSMTIPSTVSEPTSFRLNCPVIKTARLLLRPPVEGDAGEMARLANNYAVASMLGSMPHPYFAADAREFIAKIHSGESTGCVYAITSQSDGRFMGICGLHEDTTRFELPFIGYWLGEQYWASGFATEAARAMVDLFFKVTDRPMLMISCRTSNPQSRRVIEKCGGKYWKDGEQFNKALGQMHHVSHFRATREDWLAAVAD